MGQWVQLENGRRMWQEDDGSLHDGRPMQDLNPPINPDAPLIQDEVQRFFAVPGRAVDNLLTIPENATAGIMNAWNIPRGEMTPQGPGPAGPAPDAPPADAPLSPAYDLPSPDLGAIMGSSGGVPEAQFTPYPDAPVRGENPAMAAYLEHMQGREDRLGRLFEEQLAQVRRDDPRNRHWLSRIGGGLSAIAARPSLAEAGAAVQDYLASERADRRAVSDATMRLGLAREGLAGETAQAAFNAETGRWEVGNQNREAQFGVDTANVTARNTAAERTADRRFQAGMSDRQLATQVALAEYQRGVGRLDAAMAAAAESGNLGAYTSLFGNLPEEMQQEQANFAATMGLASIITEHGSRAHRKMEELAGRQLDRPPRTIRENPQAAARWYVQQGVPLGHPEVLEAFPGFGGAAQ